MLAQDEDDGLFGDFGGAAASKNNAALKKNTMHLKTEMAFA